MANNNMRGNVNCAEIDRVREEPKPPAEPEPIKPPGLEDHPRNPKFAVGNSPFADVSTNPPCFLPQPEDVNPGSGSLEAMGPVGPWATGKVDWSPLAGLTGTRPVVDRYSITRFSPNEWRAKNLETMRHQKRVFDQAIRNQYESLGTVARVSALVNNTQKATTEKIRERCQLVGKWKSILGNAIKAMADELSMLDEERRNLKQSLVVLGVPESIAKECIEIRCGRADTELVRDVPEEELVKEVALINEIRTLLKKTVEDFENQQIEDRTARERLEFDWSDKKQAYEIDTENLSYNNHSPLILFRPGAVRQPAEQASEEYWEHFSTETLEECERVRQRSIKLRKTAKSILMNAARDIRTQADVVERAFTNRINCVQENVRTFENSLKDCLQKLADTETRIGNLHATIRSFDAAMKVAQSRMYNRSFRPNVENCRDKAQQDLIDEVHKLQSGVTAMLAELDDAEKVKQDLMQLRSKLEREIMMKRRTLMLDQERCMTLRSHYPSATTLSGFASG